MSDCDSDRPPHTGWSDYETDLPVNSSVDSSVELGVNVCSPSADQTQTRALYIECWDLLPTASAPIKGNLVGHAPSEEAESCKGVKFLEAPIPTTPRSKSLPNLSCHRGWAMAR